MSNNINDLFADAQADGVLTTTSVQVLAAPDLATQINAAMGIDVDDVTASEVVLVTMEVDDSSSIRFASNAQAVREGHNLVLDALKSSQQRDQVFAHNRYLNGTVLYAYSYLDNTVEMDTTNYDPGGGTPLYDQSVVLLGSVLAKAQAFANAAVPARTVTLIITDGEDAGSHQHTAADVRQLVEDMFRSEMHIVAGMGVDNGHTDFHQVFKEMGIPDQWILTPKSTASDIRAAFMMFSQSAVRVSQTAGNLSQVALGGFGTT